jgi:hypothetical protein
VKIAFVSGNRETLPDAVVPIGLLYIMSSVPAGHEKKLIDLCFADDPISDLCGALTEFQPDLIALSMRNIQNADYSNISDNLDYYATLIGAAKSVSRAPIVVGGSGFSVMPSQLMGRLGADYGISGEGEKAFPALLRTLQAPVRRDDELALIGGLHWYRNGRLVSNSRGPAFLDLNRLPEPDRSLVDPRYYALCGIESVQTTRGCPLRCDYCTYPLIEGRVGRVREPAKIVDEMFRAIEQHPNISHFFIVDSVFNLPRTHAKNVCRELVRRGWTIPWTCYANPLGFDREFAELAVAAGCAGMEIGSDSGIDTVLQRLNKGFTTRHICQLHELCVDTGLRDCHTFILGTKGETLDDAKQTIEFAIGLDPFAAIMMIWVDDLETMDPELQQQRLVLRQQIAELLLDYRHDMKHWCVPSLGVNYSAELFTQLRRIGLEGPLWQHVRGPLKPAPRSRAPQSITG